MAYQEDISSIGRRSLPDYLQLAGLVFYGLGSVTFLIGLYLDWQMPDAYYIPALAITREPTNSGFFLLAFIFLILGYLLNTVGEYVKERRKVEVDQTQEWIVDIRNR